MVIAETGNPLQHGEMTATILQREEGRTVRVVLPVQANARAVVDSYRLAIDAVRDALSLLDGAEVESEEAGVEWPEGVVAEVAEEVFAESAETCVVLLKEALHGLSEARAQTAFRELRAVFAAQRQRVIDELRRMAVKDSSVN